MGTLPWYPRDMGKYARDTKHLTMLEHGAYNLLLDYYYSTGPLPTSNAKAMLKNCSGNDELMPDHSRIYRVCSAMTKQEQDAVDNVIDMFFTLDKNGMYRNKKADQVIEEQTKKHENRVRAGKASKSKAKLEQSSSNAPQKKNKKKNKPPYPPKGDGVDSVFKMESLITDHAMDAAKRNAPGWDIYHLMRVYDEGINDGSRDRPKKPNSAFPVWCAAYTKGKKP